jgi:hypothetical protein
MSEIENIRVLADVASESGSYEDSYKYNSRILELDIKDAKAWIDKGVAASFLTDTSGSKIGESRALIKKGIEIGVDVSKKIEIVNKIKLAYNNYCTRCNAIRGVNFNAWSWPSCKYCCNGKKSSWV